MAMMTGDGSFFIIGSDKLLASSKTKRKKGKLLASSNLEGPTFHISPPAGTPQHTQHTLSAPCIFHCLDTTLADEWLKMCKEYLSYVRRPFQSIPVRQLWKCHQSNWADAFQEWSVLQFYMGAVTSVVMGVIGTLDGHSVISVSIEVVIRIVFAYVLAHLSRFAVVRKNGCFCVLFACCQCPFVLLLWAVLSMLWGVFGMVASVKDLWHCVFCIVAPCVQATYSTILIYMGLCCFKLWIEHASEIIPPVVEMQGPRAEIVGVAQTV